MTDEGVERPVRYCAWTTIRRLGIVTHVPSDPRGRVRGECIGSAAQREQRRISRLPARLWAADWSGPSLCREIRKIDPHGTIVFCTAAARDNDRARAMRAGANAYLLSLSIRTCCARSCAPSSRFRK